MLKTCIELGLVGLGRCPWDGVRRRPAVAFMAAVAALLVAVAMVIFAPRLDLLSAQFGIVGESILWKHYKSTQSPTFPNFPWESSEARRKNHVVHQPVPRYRHKLNGCHNREFFSISQHVEAQWLRILLNYK